MIEARGAADRTKVGKRNLVPSFVSSAIDSNNFSFDAGVRRCLAACE
jgi:hypothetical protein